MTTITIRGAGDLAFPVHSGLFINNQFVPAISGETLDTTNPATGNHLATLAAAQKDDVDAAVEAAQSALRSTWKTTSPPGRGQLLHKLADLFERDAVELATLEAVDAGILLADSTHLHVPQAIEVLKYYAGWADKIDGQALEIPNGMAFTRRQPIGVCAAIVPWNAPLMITIWKLAPAIAAGNALIIKPPELCPLYAQKLAALVLEAGFPPGVVNILNGYGHQAGQAIAEHMSIRKLSFTGSSPTGRLLLKASANTNFKKVTLELGGKGPSIVFPDADIENALFWTTLGITANNGQICAAGSRIYVHSSIYNDFVKEFSKRSARAVHGDPLLPDTTKGPIISSAQHAKILSYIKEGKSSSARLLHGGDSLDGNFVANTAFADVGDNDTIMKEEIFGPVAAIAKFETESEVVGKANDSEYGLSAAIFTNDVNRAHRVAAAIETGQVTVNSWGTLNANTPFGGVKQSGFGRDMGVEALDEWTTTKVVKFNILHTQNDAPSSRL
ncbi:putative aldehyde dehydrogenase [Cucurbitaria berberidis CBS 394.84]|uniref:aldehyde dehydrogenase (NAD(+)) n=1 Tax=Cucurbitaria berberidis CBS 394.84 TaxID=1168544 RepID=A0A9P4GV82_9PLEO|nr:putative aldehyde dehydrogenase [Cucurbitaria berberidis CBS 394.84]KAF1851636.1 putative aldehyde dehydrogenase [Cucurbitaria berberidis CBS 394.84]